MDTPAPSVQALKEQSFISSPPELKNWPALQVFSFFRFLLATTFVILSHFQIGPIFLGQLDRVLFLTTVDAYLGASILGLIGAILKRPNYDLQVNIPIFFDFLAITLLMHSSGGIGTGLGILMVIIVAAHSLLAPKLLALLGAALSSTAILAEQIYVHITHSMIAPLFSQAGLLGLCIFVTAIIAAQLKQRMYKMQQLAYSRGVRLQTSLKLNAQVVAFMQEGVIVLDQNQRIQLINSAALRMLCIAADKQVHHFEDLPIRFQQAFNKWFFENEEELFQVSKDSPEIRLSGSPLSDEDNATGYVIYIHDISKAAQKAQHMKLALLGSLAANIAHEIRNPLSSVSHAAQLLNESPALKENDSKLVHMIKDNCDRMNTVIKNVLSMSKKQSSNPEVLDINEYMHHFVDQFNPPGLPPIQMRFKPLQEKCFVNIDPTQLRQMLINLCENGLRYSMRQTNQPKLDIVMACNESNNAIMIHIRDYGPGIDGRDAKHMFEPFYTTESHGSGLGLYISREICQMNGGDIYYKAEENGGSTFSIQLPRTQETRIYGSA